MALPFDWPADPRDDEFLIGPSNARAVQQLEHWSTWPVMAVVVTGPRKSGRSLIARIFAAKTGGGLIDDAERQNEAVIFHAWNRAQEERRPVVVVADAPPPEWEIKLPDLRSRLVASPMLRIGDPDEVLMAALFERQFLRRGLDARPDLIQWLVARVERTHVALLRAVDLLDQVVLERRKRLSIPLARATLQEAGLIGGHAPDPAEHP
ncbi:HdaA/DnaA family protein [Sphingomonas echinoides]|uniref:HdaA/DnaA family protein n=1 Tax=Sphingomonas echinoides TaxID=59803 RepID=UPI002413BC11|nr:DnaA/Hda family protein [Sphingomonas echinoides]